MIIRTSYTGTVFSPLAYPPHSGAMEKSVAIASEGEKEGKVIHMKLTATYRWQAAETGVRWDVLEGISSYSVLTDGSIGVQELYKIYEHAMIVLLNELKEEEAANGLPLTTHLQPLTMQQLSEELLALALVFSN